MQKKEKNVSGEEIKIMRIQAGLKQAELADLSGYSVRSISDWECGKPPKRKSTIENIVRILNNYVKPPDATESHITDSHIHGVASNNPALNKDGVKNPPVRQDHTDISEYWLDIPDTLGENVTVATIEDDMIKDKLIAVYEKRIDELEAKIREMEGRQGKPQAQGEEN